MTIYDRAPAPRLLERTDAPEVDRDGDPVIEQRIARDLLLCAYRDRYDPERWYLLAYDNDGNYLSRIASVRGPAVPDAVWSSSIEAARELYREHR